MLKFSTALGIHFECVLACILLTWRVVLKFSTALGIHFECVLACILLLGLTVILEVVHECNISANPQQSRSLLVEAVGKFPQ